MFKRNQMEAAILRTTDPDPGASGDEVRVRLKRLLDLDRKRPIGPKLFDEAYAFYSAGAPGTGREVLFSAYEVLALWIGLKLLASGLPQGRVVFLLRSYRQSLSASTPGRQVPVKEAILMRLADAALKGDLKAAAAMLALEERLAPALESMEPAACDLEDELVIASFLARRGSGRED